MIREDRELLAELARLNGEMASLALRMIEGSADSAEQRHYAWRLIAVGEKLRVRADETPGFVVEGETEKPIVLPPMTVEPDWEP